MSLTTILIESIFTTFPTLIRVLFIVTIFPIISYICLHYAIGGRIHDLTLGIVNNEVDSISECYNESLRTTDLIGLDCNLNKVSCRFIDSFDSGIAEKVS